VNSRFHEILGFLRRERILSEAGITKGTQLRFSIEVRGYVTLLWRGDLTLGEFVSGLTGTINRGFHAAWIEGAARAGVEPDELSDKELSKLTVEISQATAAVELFGIAIIEGGKARKGKLSPLLKRAEMWTSRYDEVRHTAEVYASGDKKLMWTLGRAEHCPSCLKLHGKVKRASYWAEKGILPRVPGAPYLACRGYRCDCSLVPTDEPLSPGRLPNLP